MPGGRILVVEDDADIWRALQILLQRSGYEPIWAADGADGFRRFGADTPDLVLLDVSLPKLDGWEVLDRIRTQSRVPVVLLTARGMETDKVRGLRGGADDYLTKPYSNDELVARVDALLRRSAPGGAQTSVYDDGVLFVDFGVARVRVDGIEVELTPTEFRLLVVLVQRAGRVLSVGQILDLGWEPTAAGGEGRVKFTVLNLRRKLGWEHLDNCPIENVRGFGYRYRRPPHPAG